VTPDDVHARVRRWILDQHPGHDDAQLTDATPLIEARLLTSLQVMDLVLLLEDLTGRPVDVTRLKPGVFANLAAIRQTFYPGEGA
jgi:acyl carrier protein